MFKPALAALLVTLSLSVTAQPVISNVSPGAGHAGTTVTITGSNFSATPTDNIVYFGTGRAVVSAAAGNAITAVVPAAASYQPITVTTGHRTAWSAKPFLLTFPGGSVTPASYNYAARVDSVYGLESNDLTISDFNGDRRPDIAIETRLYIRACHRRKSGNG